MKFRYLDKNKINNLPKTTGVYAFRDRRGFLYIGKAANIKNRVKNHFSQPTYKDEMFLDKVKRIGYIKTESEIEALILESELIKRYKPKYNTLWKDDKNYFYVIITDEGYVSLTHQLKIVNCKLKIDYIGPFVDGKAIKKVLRILRKTFPYYTQKKHGKELCPWCHLNLCPGPEPDLKKHKKNINNLKAVLKGKSRKVVSDLKKEMQTASKEQDFERAGELRDKISSLEKVLYNSKIISAETKPLNWLGGKITRIEAYDISNIQGKLATGSMVVFINGKPNKDLYRKFKIKITGKPNDTAMIKEVLRRRLKHKEWPSPDLFLIDGGKPQFSAAKQIIKNVPVVALAKKNNELFIGRKEPLLLKNLSREFSNLILQLRDEAHRFAIAYHKKLRKIDLGLKS